MNDVANISAGGGETAVVIMIVTAQIHERGILLRPLSYKSKYPGDVLGMLTNRPQETNPLRKDFSNLRYRQ